MNGINFSLPFTNDTPAIQIKAFERDSALTDLGKIFFIFENFNKSVIRKSIEKGNRTKTRYIGFDEKIVINIFREAKELMKCGD